ncbi:MAG: oligosaccharide flippase family protein [Nitrospira sp.]|nr:oligosaccharide flippase family protein [Nitrospira sp.]
MNLGRGFLLVATAQGLRLGAGLVVFVVLARLLGPAPFGEFAYWLAIATLLTVPVSFGSSTLVLRSFGSHPGRARETLGEVLTTKLVLGVAVLLVGLIVLTFMDSQHARGLLFMLLMAQLFESFAEFYGLGFRVQGHFAQESATATIVAAVQLAMMSAAAFFLRDLSAVALTFMLSRLIGLIITRYRSQVLTGAIGLDALGKVPQTLKRAWAYALELGLLTAYGQIDTLIIHHALGSHAVGLYQAGMKLVQGTSRLAPILAQVLLPTLAQKAGSPIEFARISARVIGVFGASGVMCWLVLGVFADGLTAGLFGAQYASLVPLLPWFGLLLCTRFLETGAGLVLVARGMQGRKVWLVAAQLLLLLAAGYVSLQSYGLKGWLLANIGTIACLLLAYAWLMRRPRPESANSSRF